METFIILVIVVIAGFSTLNEEYKNGNKVPFGCLLAVLIPMILLALYIIGFLYNLFVL